MAQNTRNVAMQFSLKNNIKRSNIIIIITCSFVIVFTAFNHLYLSMGRYWNVRVLEQFLHLYHAKTDLIDIRLLWPLITRKKHSRT